jgi:hypothetical protein
MASFNSSGKVLIGPVAGRPIWEVKPTRPRLSDLRRHWRTVHSEQASSQWRFAYRSTLRSLAPSSLSVLESWLFVLAVAYRLLQARHRVLLKEIIRYSR